MEYTYNGTANFVMSDLMQNDHAQPHGYSRAAFHSYRARANQNRSPTDKTADFLTTNFGTTTFLVANGMVFIIWIVLNFGLVRSIKPFDPFPFTFLTMVVSLEAIFLSIIVLMSQSRDSKISDIRSEIDTHIDIISEEEITKILELLVTLLHKNGIDVSNDDQLQNMLKTVDKSYLEKKLEQEVGKVV